MLRQLEELWKYAQSVAREEDKDPEPPEFKEISKEKIRQTVENINAKLKGSDGKNTAMGTVLETVLSAAVSGLLFKNAGPVVKTVGSALGSAVANQVFGEEGAKVMERVKGLVSKIRAKTKSKSKGEGFDESNNYETGGSSGS